MGNSCIHIVPVHEGDYPDAEKKAGEILDWFRQRDLVESQPSDCILSLDKQGYRLRPAINSIFKDLPWSESAFDLPSTVFGLELHAGQRQVFHPMEGADLTMTCPLCGHEHQIAESGEFLAAWYDASNDYPCCASCGQSQHINAYRFEEDWGFSNIGITFWNTGWDLSPDFLDAMRELYGAQAVRVVQVHL